VGLISKLIEHSYKMVLPPSQNSWLLGRIADVPIVLGLGGVANNCAIRSEDLLHFHSIRVYHFVSDLEGLPLG